MTAFPDIRLSTAKRTIGQMAIFLYNILARPLFVGRLKLDPSKINRLLCSLISLIASSGSSAITSPGCTS